MVDCSFKCTVKVSNIRQVLKQSKKKEKSHFFTHTHFLKVSVSRTPPHIIPRDNASPKCTTPTPPPPPPPYSLPPPLPPSSPPPPSPPPTLPPLYLLSPTPPVTQQLRPANPFWKETTEQKITSPPLSHTSSLAFVFSCGLLLTPLQHHRQHHQHHSRLHWAMFVSLHLLSLQIYSLPPLSMHKLYVSTPSYTPHLSLPV